MPKIISRSAVSSSSEAKPTESSTAPLRVYYCLCGEFILVIDKRITSLPSRKTDKAIIIRVKDENDKKASTFKLNVSLGDPLLIKRENGFERQYKFLCPRCTLPVGYQVTPAPIKSGSFIYINKGALTEIQGQIPTDALNGLEKDQ